MAAPMTTNDEDAAETLLPRTPTEAMLGLVIGDEEGCNTLRSCKCDGVWVGKCECVLSSKFEGVWVGKCEGTWVGIAVGCSVIPTV